MKKLIRCLLDGLALAWTASAVMARSQTPAPQARVIHAGRLIDGTSTTVRERVSILIEGARVADVQSGFVRPAGAQVIDLSRSTVMPGLIDSHTHITGEGTADAIIRAVTLGAVDHAVRSTLYAAILSATRNASDLLGVSDRVGSIQKGRLADVIAVDGDPLRDITEMQRVRFVMKGGVVHKEASRAAPAGSGRE